MKLCIAMIDTGKAFCVANKQFMNGIRDLAQYSSNDAVVEVSITEITVKNEKKKKSNKRLKNCAFIYLI